MGESTCFMQPFSYASGMPNPDANQGNPNPIHSLGESISFGRFMSESLSWEKWSSFSQNRYVEEAERYAQPGSVAQKKAFFEAHYKRIAAQKAAALLEQENATKDNTNNNNIPETDVEIRVGDDSGTTLNTRSTTLNPHDSQMALLKSHVGIIEELKIKNQDANSMVNFDLHDSAVKEVDLDIDKVVRTDLVTENELQPRSFVNTESPSYSENVEDKNMVSGLEDCGTSQMEKPLLKQHLKFTQDVPPSARKRNAMLSSIRSSVFRKTSKVPPSALKSMASVHPRKENFVTPCTKKPSIESTDKIKSTPRCLHKFMNSTPVKERNKSTIPSAPKIESARVAPSAWKAPKDCATPLKTPTKECVNVVKKHPVTTPSSENRRTCKPETPVRPAASGSKTTGPKWHILSAVSSKSFTACRNKLQSPSISTPFILRTEERAARRKQKLEEKFNDKEVQKVQVQTKLKEKAETEFRKLQQSLCFKARPLPDFYKEREASNHQIKVSCFKARPLPDFYKERDTSNHRIKKTPQVNPTSRTLGKKIRSKVQGAISSPASMYSLRRDSFNNVGKNNALTPTRSPSLAQFFTRENTSQIFSFDQWKPAMFFLYNSVL